MAPTVRCPWGPQAAASGAQPANSSAAARRRSGCIGREYSRGGRRDSTPAARVDCPARHHRPAAILRKVTPCFAAHERLPLPRWRCSRPSSSAPRPPRRPRNTDWTCRPSTTRSPRAMTSSPTPTARWLKATRDPARSQLLGQRRHPRRAHRAAHRGSDPRRRRRRAPPAPRRARSATTTPASWTRPRSSAGLEAAAAGLAGASTPSRIARARARARAKRCAPTSTFSTTPTCTPRTSSACGWRRTSMIPTRYLPFLLQGGLVMPDRDYYLDPSRRWPRSAAQYQAHIAAVLDAGAAAGRAGEGRAASSSSSGAWREVHWTRAQSEEVLKGNNHWTRAGASRGGRRASTGRVLRRRGPGATATSSWCGSRARSPACPRSPPANRSRPGRTTCAFTAIEAQRAYLPKAFVDEHFAFHGQVLSGTPQLRPRWKRAVDRHQRRARRGGRQAVRGALLPAGGKGARRGLVRNLVAAFAARIDRLEWMAPGHAREGQSEARHAQGRRRLSGHWRDYFGLEVVRGDAFGNVAARRALRVPAQPRQARPARSTAPSGS